MWGRGLLLSLLSSQAEVRKDEPSQGDSLLKMKASHRFRAATSTGIKYADSLISYNWMLHLLIHS